MGLALSLLLKSQSFKNRISVSSEVCSPGPRRQLCVSRIALHQFCVGKRCTHGGAPVPPWGDESGAYVKDANNCFGCFEPRFLKRACSCAVVIDAWATYLVCPSCPRITSRIMIILMILTVRSVCWLVEQPSSSQLVNYAHWRFLSEVLLRMGIDCGRTFLPLP